jgi:hypothetical protein
VLLLLRRHDAPAVVKAFLTHDLATLKQHVGKELEERLGGMFKHFEAAVSRCFKEGVL